MKKNFTIFVLLFTSNLFALITIVPVEIAQNAGVSAKLSSGFASAHGNTNKENYNAALRITYDNNASFVTWAELNGEYGASNDKEDTNKAFLHARFIHALSPQIVRGEIFGQLQEDKFKDLRSRRIIGTGVRLGFLDLIEGAKLYFGAGAMIEQIEYLTTAPRENNARLNGYTILSIPFEADSSLSYAFYFQPKIDDLNDYVNFHTLELELHAYKALFFRLSLVYEKDTNPPSGVAQEDVTQKSAFVVKF